MSSKKKAKKLDLKSFEEIRIDSGMTTQEMADTLGLGYTHYSDIERRRSNPTWAVKILLWILNKYGLSILEGYSKELFD